MNTILVQMADTRWTTATMKVASEQAATIGAQVVLVKMLPASYLNWQGIEAREYQFSASDCDDIYTYEQIARQQGVAVREAVYKYHDLAESLAQAAHDFNAAVIYAIIPTDTFLKAQHI